MGKPRHRETRRHTYLKNFLSITALILSWAALQSPLWRPADAPLSVTAKTGGSVILAYDGELENAMIFHKSTATLSAGGPGHLVIHGHAAGKTSLLIRCKHGESKLYQVVVLPS
jgi:hypothetical protein